MGRVERLKAVLLALREPGLGAGPKEQAAAASLRETSDELHREADGVDDLERRVELRLQAVEVWAAADGLVREESVR